MPDPIIVTTLTGEAISPVLPELARLRIAVFRAWPYLYDGDLEYEHAYLATLAAAPDAAVVVARQGEAIVGASTCLPLAHETENVRAPFPAAGIDPARVFYFGESVLRPECRGQGVGVRFFTEREAHARAVGGFSLAAFCKVVRAAEDMRRPAGFVPLFEFWRRRGFTHRPDLACRIDWKEVGAAAETSHLLEFWVKRLDEGGVP